MVNLLKYSRTGMEHSMFCDILGNTVRGALITITSPKCNTKVRRQGYQSGELMLLAINIVRPT